VSASLCGAHVYIVSPARENAAAGAFPQMSRMQELLTRLVLARDIFEDAIAAAGGAAPRRDLRARSAAG
jgi:hypothetical protein